MSAAPIRPRATDSGPAHATGHNPVLLHEVVAALAVREGGVYIDGTLGGGGYSRAILAAAPCTVWGIDRDPDAIERNRALAAESGERLHLVQGRFGDMDTLLADAGVSQVDGVALDLGVSSPQIDQAERGFSFAKDGPLDMRMERAGTSAADVVNEADERTLTGILRELGEERHARRVARAILAARDEAPIETTGRLAEVVRSSLPKPRFGEIDPATRTFQALRIHVNDELGELMRGLVAAEALLRPGGRLAVVSFHSLEDRRVKTFLRRRSGTAGRGSRHLPDAPDRRDPAWRLIDRKLVRPGESEIAGNPRARSARLRVGERTDAPSWGPAAEEDAG